MGIRHSIAALMLATLFFTLHALERSQPASSDSRIHPSTIANAAVSPEMQEPYFQTEAPAGPESRKMGNHHSSDKSAAGGGVIIGGLVTAIFAAVYCYIRVTRRKQ